MKRIPPKALEWQENHKDNGNDVESSNNEQEKTQKEKKKKLTFNNTATTPNPKLEPKSIYFQKTSLVPIFQTT
jgi:hypothetical protein